MDKTKLNNSSEKDQLREQFKARAVKYGFSENILNEIFSHLIAIIPKGVTVASFRGKADEVVLKNLESLRPDLKIVYPVTVGRDLEFWHPRKVDAFKMGRFQIEEPDTSQSDRVPLNKIDMVLVPGVAFDRGGGRLGRGQGYYDRALQGFTGLKVGVATVAQIADEDLPLEEHDELMDVIVTDQFMLRVFSS